MLIEPLASSIARFASTGSEIPGWISNFAISSRDKRRIPKDRCSSGSAG